MKALYPAARLLIHFRAKNCRWYSDEPILRTAISAQILRSFPRMSYIIIIRSRPESLDHQQSHRILVFHKNAVPLYDRICIGLRLGNLEPGNLFVLLAAGLEH